MHIILRGGVGFDTMVRSGRHMPSVRYFLLFAGLEKIELCDLIVSIVATNLISCGYFLWLINLILKGFTWITSSQDKVFATLLLPPPKQTTELPVKPPDPYLDYNELIRPDGRFTRYRKPDFQRETNAWTPDDCVEFLDSVVHGRIIPSIILWYSPENGLTYVLDGAHRLSVIRAWILDDWGDRTDKDYYERRDADTILKTAQFTRKLVEQKIGSFKSFKQALEEYLQLGEAGKIQIDNMGDRKFSQATFLNRAMVGIETLSVQWENGDYKSAEQSFLRINRRGQALDPWESNLIECRASSYARCIMAIASAGSDGHYWPEPSEGLSDDLIRVQTTTTGSGVEKGSTI